MFEGQDVEALAVWTATPHGPLSAWCKGYAFVRAETHPFAGPSVLLRHTRGVLEGCIVRFPRARVRAATEPS